MESTSMEIPRAKKNAIKRCLGSLKKALMKLPRWVSRKMKSNEQHTSDNEWKTDGDDNSPAATEGDGVDDNDVLPVKMEEKSSPIKYDTPALVKRGFKVIDHIGAGGYGSILLARSQRHHSQMAIKVIEKLSYGQLNDGFLQSIDNEIRFARRFDHPYLNVYHEIIVTRKRAYIVMDYFVNGTLLDYCKEVDHTPEPVAYDWFAQLCSALGYLHSHGFAHRDVKLDNVLLDGRRRIRLADFGLCVPAKRPWTESDVGLNLSICGTSLYMSPELLSREPYHGQLADVWAAGVLLYCLVVGRFPFLYADRLTGELDKAKTRILRSQAKGYDFSDSEKERLSVECQSFFGNIFVEESQRKEIKDLCKQDWMVMGAQIAKQNRYLAKYLAFHPCDQEWIKIYSSFFQINEHRLRDVIDSSKLCCRI